MLYELRKMYYDTAQATNPVAMGALRQVVPLSQIVYGTDYWYRNAAETAKQWMPAMPRRLMSIQDYRGKKILLFGL